MKMFRQAIMALSVTVAISMGNVEAGFIRGIELQNWCSSTDLTDRSSCVAYILGVHDTIERVSAGKGKQLYCLPKEVGSEDLYKVISDYLAANQKTIHLSGSSNVLLALKEQYPCQ